ncbi:MAG TPA: ribosome-associated translation inhibitor RaiA [Elusimicrobiota bacterium]|nr:ribosome-associated translation inhibitor RaiA [Elusimicrobiota bacterium]
MQVNITARHLDLTPSLADYVQKRLERVGRHFESVIRAQVVLEVEKHRHIAEIVVHANGHHDFRVKGESADLYAAIDLVAEKLHKHMAREKDRRVRGRRQSKRSLVGLPIPLIPSDGDDSFALPLTQVRRFTPRPMTVEEAVEEMEQKNYMFYVFMNDDIVSVVYKRKDKTYGLLESNL